METKHYLNAKLLTMYRDRYYLNKFSKTRVNPRLKFSSTTTGISFRLVPFLESRVLMRLETSRTEKWSYKACASGEEKKSGRE